MRVGVIGCGLIGCRRALVIRQSSDDNVVVVADLDGDAAKEAGRVVECEWTTRWADLVERDDLDAIVVATTNEWLSPISRAALESGKHVLCEKPAGRSPGEVQGIVKVADAL